METIVKPPMTILHLFSGDLWAGAEVMILNLLKQLQTRSEIQVIALSLNEGTLTERLKNAGIQTCVVDERRFSFPGILIQAWRFLKDKKVDVFHSHRYKEHLLAVLLSGMLGVRKRIATLHGMPEPTTGARGLKATWTARVNDALLRRFFQVVAVSHEMKTTLVMQRRFRADRVEVIHNGIAMPPLASNEEVRPYRSPTGTFQIGTVGRMVPVKDYAFFLEIAAEGALKNVRFSTLGGGPLQDALQRKREALGLCERVLFFCRRPIRHPIINRWIFT
jgi:glycosyltransferase involved in cell wall biosynthesis